MNTMFRRLPGEIDAVMSDTKYKYIFGPVPSRRFGRSLGVDLIPRKTCTFDCLFCQVGLTSDHTCERREYAPVAEIIAELDAWRKSDGAADFITLSGSGEPTLHTRFGEIISHVKKHMGIPMLLLTNGTLLHIPEVREAAANADIVKASLSAWDEDSFKTVNRPTQGITFEKLVEGEKELAKIKKGELWIEVFVMAGINSEPEQIRKISAIAAGIKPDRVQLNTVARPPADKSAVAVTREKLEQLASLFKPRAEIIATFKTTADDQIAVTCDKIEAMLKRRPCTAGQIAEVFNIHINEALKYITMLLDSDRIRQSRQGTEIYFITD